MVAYVFVRGEGEVNPRGERGRGEGGLLQTRQEGLMPVVWQAKGVDACIDGLMRGRPAMG